MANPELLVNLGSGPHAQDGWQNLDKSPSMTLSRAKLIRSALHRVGLIGTSNLVDWSPAIIRADLRRRLPYEDGQVTAIYSSHALEHLYFADAQRLLTDCFRVLRKGGVLRLALPDFHDIAISVLAAEAQSGLELHARLNAYPLERPRGRRRLQSLLSASHHRWQPTRQLVETMLLTAGFETVQFPTFQDGQLPDLTDIETRPASLFAETTKP
jgi:predicted SAM-dependent methyltransferase